MANLTGILIVPIDFKSCLLFTLWRKDCCMTSLQELSHSNTIQRSSMERIQIQAGFVAERFFVRMPAATFANQLLNRRPLRRRQQLRVVGLGTGDLFVGAGEQIFLDDFFVSVELVHDFRRWIGFQVTFKGEVGAFSDMCSVASGLFIWQSPVTQGLNFPYIAAIRVNLLSGPFERFN